MTRKEIRDRVNKIRELSLERDSGEAAHAAEDELMRDVLKAIRDDKLEGCNAKQAAHACLVVEKIEFERHCA